MVFWAKHLSLNVFVFKKQVHLGYLPGSPDPYKGHKMNLMAHTD